MDCEKACQNYDRDETKCITCIYCTSACFVPTKCPQAGSEAVSAEFALLGAEDIEKIKELIELQLTEATKCDLPYATAWLRRQKADILSRVAVLEKIVSAAT